MNKTMIIGNLTNDPETRTTQSGDSVCSFTVAVNRPYKNKDGKQEADFFRVSAWRTLADNCQRFLAKGRKVFVCGTVSVSTYTTQNGETRANLNLTASEVEFLTPKGDQANDNPKPAEQTKSDPAKPDISGMTVVENEEDLPF